MAESGVEARWRKGRLILVAQVACARAGCDRTASSWGLPVAELGHAAALMALLGWGLDADGGWVCPLHAERPADDQDS